MHRSFCDSLLDNPLGSRYWSNRSCAPSFQTLFDVAMGSSITLPVRISKTDKAFVLQAQVPGVKPADVEVGLEGRRLQIAVKAPEKVEAVEGLLVDEWSESPTASRKFLFDRDVDRDHVSARQADGILTVTVPFAATSLPVKIDIQAGTAE